MPSFTDQTGRAVHLSSVPQRIVSLVPSQTELLAYFALDERVVGITSFCVRPEHWYRNKTRVGGTKNFLRDRIDALQPDLIIANKEENEKLAIEALAGVYPVWISDICNVEQAFDMISSLGELLQVELQAKQLISVIRGRFNAYANPGRKLRAAYLIWNEPMMTIGGDTYISDMLGHAGFQNIFADKLRYPSVTVEDIAERQCEVVILSSEPFPFSEKHAATLRSQLPGIKVVLADGEMFSWYGSRMLEAPEYFASLRSHIGK